MTARARKRRKTDRVEVGQIYRSLGYTEKRLVRVLRVRADPPTAMVVGVTATGRRARSERGRLPWRVYLTYRDGRWQMPPQGYALEKSP